MYIKKRAKMPTYAFFILIAANTGTTLKFTYFSKRKYTILILIFPDNDEKTLNTGN